MTFSVVPIAEEHTEGFRAVVDSVAREHRYLVLLEALLRATLERARAAGLTRIELTVRENNQRVVALYEHGAYFLKGKR